MAEESGDLSELKNRHFDIGKMKGKESLLLIRLSYFFFLLM